jgi:hypothetical protein
VQTGASTHVEYHTVGPQHRWEDATLTRQLAGGFCRHRPTAKRNAVKSGEEVVKPYAHDDRWFVLTL